MMTKKAKVVALIPARGGSKRLKNKNLLPMAGKPLIGWTIDAALNCVEIDSVVVSTDCLEIKKTAIAFKAEVPFIRPADLATDYASTDDVMLHAINKLQLSPSDIVVLLQPTSPLRDEQDISLFVHDLLDSDLSGVVSVCECEHTPLWSNTLPQDLRMGEFINPTIGSKRSQDLPQYYRLNGAIYAYRVEYLRRYGGRYYSSEVKARVMSAEKSVDIDTELDFKFAEFLMKNK